MRLEHSRSLKQDTDAAGQDATLSFIVAKQGQLLSSIDIVFEQGKDPDSVEPGTLLSDRYELLGVLGRGGMGQVFLATDRRLQRPVAVKIIRPDHWAMMCSGEAENVKQAFEAEAQLGANLLHPGIATVYDYGFHGNQPYTVFEYVAGTTLRELIAKRAPLPIEDVRDMVGQLASALDYAHEKGIVHRDLKPENIRFAENGECKILDLGLAKDFRRQTDWRFAGTPAYASPEQASERPSDGRADQYALAVITYELLTAHRVFEGKSWSEVLEMHKSQPPVSPRHWNSGVPDDVAATVLRGLEKEPNARYSQCGEFAAALGAHFRAMAPSAGAILKRGPANLRPLIRDSFRESLRQSFRFARRAYLVLQSDQLWIGADDRIECWPRAALKRVTRSGGVLRIDFFRGNKSIRQSFDVGCTAEATHWQELLAPKASEPPASPEASAGEPEREIPVLLTSRPSVRMQLRGMCEASESSRKQSELALRVLAAVRGADAVVDVAEEKLFHEDRTVYRASGTAAKSVDSAGAWEFITRWYGGECQRICNRLFVFVLVCLILRALGALFISAIGSSARLTSGAEFAIAVATLLILHLVPFLFVTVFAMTKWPQLLRPLALTIAALALVSIAVLASMSLTMLATRSLDLEQLMLVGMTFDPVNIFLILFGVALAMRLGWIAKRYFAIAASRRTVHAAAARPAIGWGAWSISLAYALGAIGFFGFSGYQQGLLALPGARDAVMGAQAVHQGNTSEALTRIQSALAANPNNADALVNLSYLQLRNGELEAAVESARKAIELRPNSALAYSNRSAALRMLGKHEDSIRDSTEAIRLNPRFPLGHFNRGIARINLAAARDDLSQLDLGIADCETALKLDPNSGEIGPVLNVGLRNRALAYIKRKQLDRSIDDCTRAIEVAPSQAEAYVLRAACFIDSGAPEKALSDGRRAAELNSGSGPAHRLMGLALFHLERYEECLESTSEAIRLEPSHYHAYAIRAQAYARLGRADEAQRDLEQAQLRNPATPSQPN